MNVFIWSLIFYCFSCFHTSHMLYQTIRIVYNLLFLIQCYTSDYVHVKEVLDYLFKGCIVHCKISSWWTCRESFNNPSAFYATAKQPPVVLSISPLFISSPPEVYPSQHQNFSKEHIFSSLASFKLLSLQLYRTKNGHAVIIY